jgi:hypothetical protein
MAFFDYVFDNEFKQRTDIESLKRMSRNRIAARRRQFSQLQDQGKRIEHLEEQVGELALLCRSLLTILREDGTVEPERFQQVMDRIDAEDGTLDGKLNVEPPPEDPPTTPDINVW